MVRVPGLKPGGLGLHPVTTQFLGKGLYLMRIDGRLEDGSEASLATFFPESDSFGVHCGERGQFLVSSGGQLVVSATCF